MATPLVAMAITWFLQTLYTTMYLRSLCDARPHDNFMPNDIMNTKVRHGKYLHITTLLIEPYVSQYNNSVNIVPEASRRTSRYYGYMVDVLDRLGVQVRFRYLLQPVMDGEFGFSRPDGSGEWSGMVGQLLQKRADFAAAPMYPTAKRKEVLDFSDPYMDVTAAVVISKRADGSHKQFSTIEDIYKREDMFIGTQDRGLIHRAIRLSNNSFVKKLYERMQNTKHLSFTESNEQGLDRVRNYNYAFILPNRIVEYVANRKPCDLHVINTTLWRQQFAFATTRGSELLPFLNNGLRVLRDNGDLDAIYHEWWVEKGECSSDTRRHAPEKTMRYEHVTTYGSSSALISLHLMSLLSISVMTAILTDR